MRILYHHRIASKDGQNVHVEEIVGALRELGHTVHVVAPRMHETEDFGHAGGWVARLKASLPKAVYELLEMAYSIHAYFRLAGAIRKFKPDVLYERYNLFLFAGIWAKKRFKLPFLLEINSPIAEERSQYDGMAFKSLAMKAQSHVWRQADVCLPVTAVLSQYLIRAGVPQDRIEIIHNGINLKHFANLPDGGGVRRSLGIEGRIVLGFTGFVRTWHGLDKVIRWMARGQRQDIQLLVVGEGPAREELEELARQVNLADRISFTGLVHRDRVPEYVAAFDVALQPAVVDYASPLKLFEYLALGRAVIAPCKPNLMEVLQDDVNALLFETDREGAFEAGLSRLCEDAALRARLGEAARRTIQDGGYTWQANAMRITSLFERLRKAGPN